MAIEELAEQEITVKIIALRPKSHAQQGWRSFFMAWGRTAQAVLPTFLITRLVLLLLTYFAGVIFNAPPIPRSL